MLGSLNVFPGISLDPFSFLYGFLIALLALFPSIVITTCIIILGVIAYRAWRRSETPIKKERL